MKIAVVGGGVSGLVSAYLLASEHQVTVFEKDTRLGGHAHSISVPTDSGDVFVDNGFMVFNPSQYPHFVGLLSELGVETIQTNMSFSVDIENTVRYRGNFPKGLFADKQNVFRLRFWRFLANLLRMQRIAKRELKRGSIRDQTLGEFLAQHRISHDVSDWFLYPMLSAVWSMRDTRSVEDFPALATFTFLNNHNLLNLRKPRWRTIKGGSRSYVDAIVNRIKDLGGVIQSDVDIETITRHQNGVHIQLGDKTQEFDAVVMATHANTALTLLADASALEEEALSCFSYSQNETILHTDKNQVSPNKNVLAAWNYRDDGSGQQAVFTYCMNILQHIDQASPVFVTLNPKTPIDATKIIHTEHYEHPRYSHKSLEGQRLISEIQGERQTYFVGAHLGYGFHEDGVASAVRIAQQFDVSLPWQK